MKAFVVSLVAIACGGVALAAAPAPAATWDAWAKRTHAVPWPWKPVYGETAAKNANE